jgi:DNA-binding PadR family transcriptional regulator
MPRLPGLASLHVLQALARGVEYGFDICNETALPSGTVYPALSRFERDGHVRSSWEDAARARREGRPPRRYYRITAEGRRALETMLADLGVGAVRRARTARARS